MKLLPGHLVGIVCAVASVLLVAPPRSDAVTKIYVADAFDDGRGSYPAEVTVQGDGTDNRIRVHWSKSPRGLIVRDNGGIEGRRCKRLAANAMRCPFKDPELWIDGMKGRDYIRVGLDVPPTDATFIDGGPSTDVLFGGAYDDYMYGGDGDDVLTGRGGGDNLAGDFGRVYPRPNQHGDDVLRGGAGEDFVGDAFDRGRDILIGGSDDDEILSRDFSRDRRIRCGAGHDTVDKDPRDPRPTNCELRDRVS